MKNLISTIIILLVCVALKAQHTLQFNRAILVSTEQSVPNNTVWKVVSVLPSSMAISNVSGYPSAPAVSAFAITINSNPVYFSNVNGGWEGANQNNFAYTNATGTENLNMWLPAGTTLAASTNIQYISVIEFIVN